MRRRTAALAAIVLAGWLAACASRSGEERVLSPDQQFARATELYERREYRDAIRAFQVFTFNYPQDPRAVEARWLTARAHYELKDWATAAQEFLDFQRDHPAASRAAEALFMAGRSFQQMSLRPELDQRDSERAINVYDRLLREYPRSDFHEEARTRRAHLRNKMAEKSYLNAEFYFDHRRYRGAEIYLTDVIQMFPDTDWVAPSYALLARTYCAWGRHDRSVEMVRVLHEQFQESAAAREVLRQLPSRCRDAEVQERPLSQ